jgi:hypothetical protein
MNNAPVLSTLSLPPELDADDVLGLRDQIRARLAAVVPPKGKKKGAGSGVALPEGVEPLSELPRHIELPWKRFDAAVDELQGLRHARASAQAEEAHAASDESERVAANTDVDDRWRAFEQWNGGAAGLAEDGAKPSPSEARWLYAQLFAAPEGLRFITRRPRAQWVAMVQRMSVLSEERAKAVIEGFGGLRHWQQLAKAHARFGKAYGFTTVVTEPVGSPTDGRPQWTTARDALRALVQKVETYADPDLEGSEALVAFLLEPYVEVVNDLAKSRRASRSKRADSAPTPPDGAAGTP